MLRAIPPTPRSPDDRPFPQRRHPPPAFFREGDAPRPHTPRRWGEALTHVVIFSSGRSGSNRLLDGFDRHGATNCRNEVHVLDTAIGRLPKRADGMPPDETFRALWAEAVDTSRRSRSVRDRFTEPKSYLVEPLRRIASQAYRRGRLRAVLGIRSDEWPISAPLLRGDTSKIVPVLKIADHPEWFLDHHAATPGQFLIHNLRHPLGYLRSWYIRLIVAGRREPEADYEITRGAIASKAAPPDVAPLPARYSLLNLYKAQLLYWRVQNEPLLTALSGSARYKVVTYEATSRDLQGTMTDLFGFAGLTVGPDLRARLTAMTNTLFARPHTDEIDGEAAGEAMAYALGGSPLMNLWKKTGEPIGAADTMTQATG